jgi:c-di-GMP-binding flagellar brake protein YcgR
MKNESVKPQLTSAGKESEPMVRQSFRIPVSEKESVQVLIKHRKYHVSNISREGIGIGFGIQPDLKFGEVLTGCELILKKERLKGLSGRVIHYSSSASGQLQHGIQWSDLEDGQQKAIDQFCLQMKTQALENHDRNIS